MEGLSIPMRPRPHSVRLKILVANNQMTKKQENKAYSKYRLMSIAWTAGVSGRAMNPSFTPHYDPAVTKLYNRYYRYGYIQRRAAHAGLAKKCRVTPLMIQAMVLP